MIAFDITKFSSDLYEFCRCDSNILNIIANEIGGSEWSVKVLCMGLCAPSMPVFITVCHIMSKDPREYFCWKEDLKRKIEIFT